MGSRQKNHRHARPRWLIGWLMTADGSALDCSNSLLKLQRNEFWVEIEPVLEGCSEGDPVKLRYLFSKLVSSFLKKICARDSFQSQIPMLGDGQCMDLFKLFLIVKEKGGYDTVSKNGLWDTVAEEYGLGSGVSSAVKVVYVKYLTTFERWFERIFEDMNSKGGSMDSGVNSGGLLVGLEAEFKDFFSDISDQKKKRGEEYPHFDLANSKLNFVTPGRLSDNDDVARFVEVDGGKRGADDDNEVRCSGWSDGGKRCVDDDNDMSCLAQSNGGKACSYHENEVECLVLSDGGRRCADDNKEDDVIILDSAVRRCADDEKDDDVIILDSSVINEEFFCRKRKRGSFLRMLNWVTEVAKDPCDPVIGTLPERSKWKLYGVEEFWKQALLAREALFFKRPVDSSSEQTIWQKKQRMHPSMYDDHIESSHQLAERLRCSQRLLSVKKSQARACSESPASGTQSDLEISPGHSGAAMVDNLDRQFLGATNSLTDTAVDLSGNSHNRKRIPVGPFFQVDVPEWTGVTLESDAKWLGTQVWPAEKRQSSFLIERDRIGKGRQDSCGCQFPGSVECVRFHITEKRKKVELELGSAFYRWKFDKIGEDVALSWADEDKRKFATIVRLNPASLDKCFWDQIFKFFPDKSREDVVSYYFNVFLLRRRGNQNRYTPNNIDSDDDESEIGSLANGLGHEAIRSPGSIFYAQSKPHMNFR
ncbi:AT-rich interactive domain-containing protein 1 [Malania oleifera]|uniref:AT-rich interactive domain-containing protein 1 n=1 Tax=Malania oleifera TaxID=397392 RepID=UPI0025AE3853|nr:AT-rich interactive domain-containing protein 1 [Malania oleifera]